MFKLRPTILIALSFLAVILTGGLLLSLPISSSTGTYTNIIDALFTANSATCVTGLVVLDTGTHFSLFGKLVILTLIQIGGLGYMTFSVFMVLFFRKKMFVSEKILMQEMLNIYSMRDVINVIRRIFIIVFSIEMAGAAILFFRWLPELGFYKALEWGIFHSVSAFCNAGFALPARFQSFIPYSSDPVIIFTIAALIILGGLGFLVISDTLQNRRFSLQSKVVLWTTGVLIAVGMLAVLGMEFNNPDTLGKMGTGQKLMVSFFQSITPRTAGFDVLNAADLHNPTLLLVMLLMFIGASPGGTGGGIKTTTFALILATIWATLQNSKNTIISERRIPPEIVRKAFSVFFISVAVVSCGIFFMDVFENHHLMQLAFEVISAFGTVGLSTGITPILTDGGKITIMVVMFLGRVGTLAFLSGMTVEEKKPNIKYPKEGIAIG